MASVDEFTTKAQPNWCPGCGNFAILTALKMALSELNLSPDEVTLTSGIGCSSKIPQWIRSYGYNGLHGRPLVLAQGIALANKALKVIACGGDGDGYAEGTNHFIHFCRRNINLTYIVHNNQIYALTKGQASPTSEEGLMTKTTPFGYLEKQLNPVLLALSSGATFVARGYAGDLVQLKDLMKKAITHKGSALLDVLQPCVTFNKLNTYAWYKERVYYLKEPLSNRVEAIKKSMEWGKKIPCGVFYESVEKTLDDKHPVLKDKPLIHQELFNNINVLFKDFK